MPTLNVSLPDELKKVVDERVAEGRFASHSEYVRSLIRKDQRRVEHEQLEAKLLARLHTGESTPMTHADFERIQERLRGYLSRRKAKKKAKR